MTYDNNQAQPHAASSCAPSNERTRRQGDKETDSIARLLVRSARPSSRPTALVFGEAKISSSWQQPLDTPRPVPSIKGQAETFHFGCDVTERPSPVQPQPAVLSNTHPSRAYVLRTPPNTSKHLFRGVLEQRRRVSCSRWMRRSMAARLHPEHLVIIAASVSCHLRRTEARRAKNSQLLSKQAPSPTADRART